MTDFYGGTFGGYAASTVVLTQAAKDALRVEVNKLSALLPDPFDDFGNGVRVTGAHTDFDLITPDMASRIQKELAGLMETSIESAAEA